LMMPFIFHIEIANFFTEVECCNVVIG